MLESHRASHLASATEQAEAIGCSNHGVAAQNTVQEPDSAIGQLRYLPMTRTRKGKISCPRNPEMRYYVGRRCFEVERAPEGLDHTFCGNLHHSTHHDMNTHEDRDRR